MIFLPSLDLNPQFWIICPWNSRICFSQAAGHIEAGAKKVIISAPGKGDLKTLVSEDCIWDFWSFVWGKEFIKFWVLLFWLGGMLQQNLRMIQLEVFVAGRFGSWCYLKTLVSATSIQYGHHLGLRCEPHRVRQGQPQCGVQRLLHHQLPGSYRPCLVEGECVSTECVSTKLLNGCSFVKYLDFKNCIHIGNVY